MSKGREIVNKSDRQLLKEHIDRFNFDPTDEQRAVVLDIVRRVDPKGYDNLMKSQCAYEFHMILDAILDP